MGFRLGLEKDSIASLGSYRRLFYTLNPKPNPNPNPNQNPNQNQNPNLKLVPHSFTNLKVEFGLGLYQTQDLRRSLGVGLGVRPGVGLGVVLGT